MSTIRFSSHSTARTPNAPALSGENRLVASKSRIQMLMVMPTQTSPSIKLTVRWQKSSLSLQIIDRLRPTHRLNLRAEDYNNLVMLETVAFAPENRILQPAKPSAV